MPLGEPLIIKTIDDLADKLRAGIPERDVRADAGRLRLRLLDAALWRWAPKKKRR